MEFREHLCCVHRRQEQLNVFAIFTFSPVSCRLPWAVAPQTNVITSWPCSVFSWVSSRNSLMSNVKMCANGHDRPRK